MVVASSSHLRLLIPPDRSVPVHVERNQRAPVTGGLGVEVGAQPPEDLALGIDRRRRRRGRVGRASALGRYDNVEEEPPGAVFASAPGLHLVDPCPNQRPNRLACRFFRRETGWWGGVRERAKSEGIGGTDLEEAGRGEGGYQAQPLLIGFAVSQGRREMQRRCVRRVQPWSLPNKDYYYCSSSSSLDKPIFVYLSTVLRKSGFRGCKRLT